MLRAIIIDDEPLAVHIMKKTVDDLGIVDIAETFLNPVEALQWVAQKKIDLVFLDIEMGEISGMEVAEQLSHFYPHIHIVFVTAYNHYAVEAFELNALDYVLKPVQKQRLKKTLERIVSRQEMHGLRDEDQKPPKEEKGMLCFFQYISTYFSQQGIQKIFWRTAKAQELFAYLIHYRHKHVRKEEILELLWPDMKLDRASSLLHTTIYQVRKTIQEHGLHVAIKYKDEGYYLEKEDLIFDVDEWERGLGGLGEVTDTSIEQHQQLTELYRGDYLQDCPYIWKEAEQERLRLLWLEHIKKIVAYYVQQQRYTDAIPYYNQMKELHPYLEEGYFGLMKMNAALGYQAEVKKNFDKLVLRFQEDLGVQPKREVLDWYMEWSLTSS
ncbi:response regulator [Bacillus horti]|uniref:Two-component SAPR family response regulator n=1 Tax=Caldalkalibacillus horti TaxID=77523 RepID=A0ABT9VTP4_9BACI|nr:response regulator [Bacillus horti]MDQ0164352.1 two-component SAPR family response regulator [Bacillus horti]